MGGSGAATLPGLSGAMMRFAPGVIVPALINLAAAALFTRIFSRDDYGRYALALASTMMVVMVVTQWLQQSVLRFVPVSTEATSLQELRAAIAAAGVWLVTGSVAAAALIAVIGVPFLRQEWRGVAFAALALGAGGVAYQCARSVLQAELRSVTHSGFQAVLSLAGFGLTLLGLLIIRDPALLLWGPAIATLIIVPFAWRSAGLTPIAVRSGGSPAVRRRMNDLVAYGWPMVGWFLISGSFDVANRYVIQIARGADEVGLYSACYSIVVGAAGLLVLPLNLALHPHLMRCMSSGDEATAARLIRQLCNAALAVTIAAVGAAVLLSRPLFGIVVGPEFRSAFIAAPPVLAGAMLWQIAMITHKPLEYAQRTRTLLFASAVVFLLNLASSMLLVPRYGYIAAAYVTPFCYAAYVLITTIAGRRALPWVVDYRFAIMSVLVGVTGFGLAAYMLQHSTSAPAIGATALIAVLTTLALLVPGLPGMPWSRGDALPWNTRAAS